MREMAKLNNHDAAFYYATKQLNYLREQDLIIKLLQNSDSTRICYRTENVALAAVLVE